MKLLINYSLLYISHQAEAGWSVSYERMPQPQQTESAVEASGSVSWVESVFQIEYMYYNSDNNN